MVVLFTKMRKKLVFPFSSTIERKIHREFYCEDFNLKVLFKHLSGDAEDGVRCASLEPRDKG